MACIVVFFLFHLHVWTLRGNTYSRSQHAPSEQGTLSCQLVAQECFRPQDPEAHTVMMVEDDLEPISPQIVLSGILSKACDDVLEHGLRGVVVQPWPYMLGKLKFVVPVVSEKDPMG